MLYGGDRALPLKKGWALRGNRVFP